MFFEVFSKLCSERGITPTGASSKIGFSKGSVSYWKKKYNEGIDAKPDSNTAQKIADYFGVSVDYLFGREKNEDDEEVHYQYDQKLNKDLIKNIEKFSVLETSIVIELLAQMLVKRREIRYEGKRYHSFLVSQNEKIIIEKLRSDSDFKESVKALLSNNNGASNRNINVSNDVIKTVLNGEIEAKKPLN